MRTFGKITNSDGTYFWQEVTTDANGFSDAIWLTTLCQVLQGSPGESPFYSNYGIPALASVQSAIPPDFYMARTQQQFAPYFANLQIVKTEGLDRFGRPAPAYNVTAVTHQGAILGNVIST